jgi:hypothetical protein
MDGRQPNDDSHNPLHVFAGVKWAIFSGVFALGGLSQAVFGWAGDSLYMRVVYPILALLAAGVLGLFAYVSLNQPALRRKEAEAKARKMAQEK